MEHEFTKPELERLVELAVLGDWMINAHRPPEEASAEHQAALRKLLALAEENGLGYLVETDEETGELWPSEALLSRLDLAGYIPDYDDCVFWDELALRLAERDLETEIDTKAYEGLTPGERAARVDEIADRWDAELDKHGLERLGLPEGTPPARPRRDRLTERLKRLLGDRD